MKLSVPIFHLKRDAKRMARQHSVPLHDALDKVARNEGFASWSLLASRHAGISVAAKLYSWLEAGDLVLVGARPRQGKTLMALDVAAHAVRTGKKSVFFTLEYNESDIRDRLRDIDFEPSVFGDRFGYDCSDQICADYIIAQLQFAAPGTVVVVDYLQLLDQKRENPPLAAQLAALKAFVTTRGLIMMVISQIDRSYDAVSQALPRLADVRLPNPLDLSLFTKACFLNESAVDMVAIG